MREREEKDINIYIYIEREREKERERDIYRERERTLRGHSCCESQTRSFLHSHNRTKVTAHMKQLPPIAPFPEAKHCKTKESGLREVGEGF